MRKHRIISFIPTIIAIVIGISVFLYMVLAKNLSSSFIEALKATKNYLFNFTEDFIFPRMLVVLSVYLGWFLILVLIIRAFEKKGSLFYPLMLLIGEVIIYGAWYYFADFKALFLKFSTINKIIPILLYIIPVFFGVGILYTLYKAIFITTKPMILQRDDCDNQVFNTTPELISQPISPNLENKNKEELDENSEQIMEDIIDESLLIIDFSSKEIICLDNSLEEISVEETDNLPLTEVKLVEHKGDKHSFKDTLLSLQTDAQNRYNDIRNELQSYKLVTQRMLIAADSYRLRGQLVAKISIVGKSVYLNLALNPNKFDVNKYHHQDFNAKREFIDVPLSIKISSPRALKYAKELIEILMSNLETEVNNKYRTKNYLQEVHTI